MPGEDLVIGLDPKKYPTGRISRAILDFSGNDWMCKVNSLFKCELSPVASTSAKRPASPLRLNTIPCT